MRGPLKTVRVLLDPGHGGQNTGCVWPPQREWDYDEGTWKGADQHFVEATHTVKLMWMVAKRLRASSLKHGLDILTASTRYLQDASADWRDRRASEKMHEADLVASIHFNSFAADPSALRGASAFYWPGSQLGRLMATTFAAALPDELRGNAKKVVQVDVDDPQHWTRHARHVIKNYAAPTCLYEVCFISNNLDRDFYNSDAGPSLIANAITLSILAAAKSFTGVEP